ncbi:MAG: SGNH/GDSL hydrolase family protein [Fibrobacterota bacterium]
MKRLLRWVFLLGLIAGIGAQEGDTLRIMPIGNSITAGSLGSAGYTCNNYRVWLWNMLRDSLGRPFNFVGCSNTNLCGAGSGHNGYGGYKIRDIMAYLCLPSCRPTLALVHAGANDFYYDNLVRNLPLDSTVKDLDTLISRLYSYNQRIKILLAGHIPWNTKCFPTNYPVPNTLIREYSRRVCRLAVQKRKAGWNIYFVNHNKPFFDNGGTCLLQSDWVHPNDSGYHVMAKTWYPYCVRDTIDYDRYYPVQQNGDTTELIETSVRIICSGACDSGLASCSLSTLRSGARWIGLYDVPMDSTKILIPASMDSVPICLADGDSEWRPWTDYSIEEGWFVLRHVPLSAQWATGVAGTPVAGGKSLLTAGSPVRLFPNPFAPFVSIEIPASLKPISVEILDLKGALILVYSGKAVTGWDGTLADGKKAPSGFYLVRVKAGTRTWSKRIALIR